MRCVNPALIGTDASRFAQARRCGQPVMNELHDDLRPASCVERCSTVVSAAGSGDLSRYSIFGLGRGVCDLRRRCALYGRMILMRSALIFTLAACLLVCLPAASIAVTNATDPAGDNCVGGGCGPDLTSMLDSVDADGAAHLTIGRTGTYCARSILPSADVQPAVLILPASATSNTEAVLATIYTTSNSASVSWPYVWDASGSSTSVVSSVTSSSISITVPASVIAAAGGLPLKYYVSVCATAPGQQWYESRELMPNSGLFTLEASVTDKCLNIPGVQASVPTGYVRDVSGMCLRVAFSGGGGANTIVGNAAANIISGLGGNDALYGRAGNDKLLGGAGSDKLYGELGADILSGGLGADTARGGAGADVLTGDAGADKLYGDAGNDKLNGNDHRGGDLISGGAGRDTCIYNAGDVLVSCEVKIKRA